MPRCLSAVVVALGAVVLLAACSDVGDGPSGAPKLEGALHPAALPVYTPSRLESIMGGTTSGGEGEGSKSLSWFFKTSDEMDKVEAWYDAQLSRALKELDEEDGEVRYSWVAAGLDETRGEGFRVTLRRNVKEIQLTEIVRASKRP